ncbi:hypothetical protein VTK73DRAFT_6467 [Phialemonium thermophilum]|uniref:Uncharacterized protein n=1 Tax=Phialemonium thermophilum TaxID=223376 RepID=A0ABR3UZK6_9PEZI
MSAIVSLTILSSELSTRIRFHSCRVRQISSISSRWICSSCSIVHPDVCSAVVSRNAATARSFTTTCCCGCCDDAADDPAWRATDPSLPFRASLLRLLLLLLPLPTLTLLPMLMWLLLLLLGCLRSPPLGWLPSSLSRFAMLTADDTRALPWSPPLWRLLLLLALRLRVRPRLVARRQLAGAPRLRARLGLCVRQRLRRRLLRLEVIVVVVVVVVVVAVAAAAVVHTVGGLRAPGAVRSGAPVRRRV